ncbi:MAG: hypothetical protein Q4P06_05960 [Actinomycetaceae bacterium]|nr:hypothetical protein [Actinomycetaceae bacterium]
MSSAAVSHTRPLSTPRLHTRNAPAPLRVVGTASNNRAGVKYLILIVITLLGILAGNLYLNTQMVQTAYDIRKSEIELIRLQEETQGLEQALQKVSAPTALREAAHAHGMVPAGTTGLISIAERTVEGGTPAHR